MNTNKNRFLESAEELKKVPVLTLCAMLAALSMVLKMVASIDIGPYIRIGFTSIPLMLADAMFGPVTGGLLAGILDVVNYMIKPSGAFFFGFTFSAILGGIIYGWFWYKKELTFLRILIAKCVVAVVVNMFLGTLWLSMLYGKGFFVLLPTRVLKNAIMAPIESVIFFIIIKAIEKTGVIAKFRQGLAKA